jgi:hypothetical protein
MAWRLEPGSDLVLNLHLIAPDRGGPQPVQPSIGFYFTDAPPTRMSLDIRLGSKSIEIPAGAAMHTIEDRFTLPVDVDALSIYPHAHYLAREIRGEAVTPDGTITPLLWIRRWDFHWQDEYRYTAPVPLPAGTTLTVRFTYDNSGANPRAPSPPRAVAHGPLSSDEMGDLWLRLVPRTPADAATLVESWRAHEARKELEAAQRLVARYPREARWRNALAASYIEAGRTLEAIKHLEEALRLAPGDALVHLNLADALADHGELDAAIAHYRQAIAINPKSREAHNNLGVALGSLGRLDEAIASFRAALDIDPGYGDARANLATALGARR